MYVHYCEETKNLSSTDKTINKINQYLLIETSLCNISFFIHKNYGHYPMIAKPFYGNVEIRLANLDMLYLKNIVWNQYFHNFTSSNTPIPNGLANLL